MGLVRTVFALLLLTSLAVASVSLFGAQSTRLRITNGCATAPMWIFTLIGANGGNLSAPSKVFLRAGGDYYDFPIPDKGLASSRFWPGMFCDQYGNNCTIGQSGGPPSDGFSCPDKYGCAPGIDSKFEGTFGCLLSDPSQCQLNPANKMPLGSGDNWDTSMVDGFTLPYQVLVKGVCPGGPKSNMIDCSKLSLAMCPTNTDLSSGGRFPSLTNQDLTLYYPFTNDAVGCLSPCSKLSVEQWQSAPNPPFHEKTYTPDAPQAQYYCCPTPPISVDQCRQGPVDSSEFVNVIHKYCPQTYAYAYDDGVGDWGCPGGTQYEVVFYCPT